MKNRTICATQNEQIEWIEQFVQEIHETKQRNRRLNAIKQQLEELDISDYNFETTPLSDILYRFSDTAKIYCETSNVNIFLYTISNYRISR